MRSSNDSKESLTDEQNTKVVSSRKNKISDNLMSKQEFYKTISIILFRCRVINRISYSGFYFVLMFISIFCSTTQAHNSVVVVPMGDNIATEEPIPIVPVAGVATTSDDNYTGFALATVIDNQTGLQWQRTDATSPLNWQEANEFCQSLNLIGLIDWRLPSITELTSLVNYFAGFPPLINSIFVNTDANRYWTATTLASSSGSAWFVDFNNGNTSFSVKTTTRFVRCVR